MQIEIKRLKDINDKTLLYLTIENMAGDKIHINIGEKTANKVTDLMLKQAEYITTKKPLQDVQKTAPVK
nr:MAG: hypothetical protein [Microviridae sp.]